MRESHIRNNRKRVRPEEQQRPTDAELLRTKFRIDAPEAVAGWTPTKPPPGAKPLGVFRDYEIPHSPGARERMVWCCFCQERNHHTGGLIRFSDGSLRTIGWKCCKDKLRIDVKVLRRTFDADRARVTLLNEYKAAYAVLEDVHHEVAGRLNASELRTFSDKRAEFFEKLEWLATTLSETVITKSGQIAWEEQITHYAGSATTRETEGDTGTTVRGAKKGYVARSYAIRGGEFLDRRVDPAQRLKRVFDLLEWMQSQRTENTDGLSDEALRGIVRHLRQAADGMAEVERALAALPTFFAPDNLSNMVAAYRRRHPKTRITAIGDRLEMRRSAGDTVTVRAPANYIPWTFRTLGRLRGRL